MNVLEFVGQLIEPGLPGGRRGTDQCDRIGLHICLADVLQKGHEEPGELGNAFIDENGDADPSSGIRARQGREVERLFQDIAQDLNGIGKIGGWSGARADEEIALVDVDFERLPSPRDAGAHGDVLNKKRAGVIVRRWRRDAMCVGRLAASRSQGARFPRASPLVRGAIAVSRLNFRVRTSELERQRDFFLVPRGVSGSDNRQMGQWRFGKVRCQKNDPLSPGNVSTLVVQATQVMLAK